MERKLLLPIAILLLFAFNTTAETVPDLPALPIDSSLKIVEHNEGEKISFWEKFLNFFGFSNEKKEDAAQEEKTRGDVSEDITTDIPEFDSSKLQIKRLDEEESVAEAVGNNSDSEKANPSDANNVQESEALEIPKGFEEDGPLKLPDGISELVESVETEVEKNINDNNISQSTDITKSQPLDTSKEKLQEQEVEMSFTNKNSESQIDSNQKTDDISDLKLPDGFDDITIEDSKQAETPKQETVEQGVEKIEESKNPPLKPANTANIANITNATNVTNTLDTVQVTDNSLNDNATDVTTKNVTLPKDDVQTTDKPVDNLPEKGNLENNPISDASLPVPNYAKTQEDSTKPESIIEKFKRNFTSKKSQPIELPKITEEDYETNEKGEIKKEFTEIDSIQMEFINNETQVLILPDDDVVLGELTEKAKINQMDLYSYIKLFWENYHKLKREPQRKVIESFIEEYDENFNQEKY